MKRFLIIAILLSYSIASIGVSLNYFYCCGKLKSISVIGKSENKRCKSKSGRGCCENQTIIYKLNTDQKTTNQSSIYLSVSNFILPIPIVSLLVNSCASSKDLHTYSKRPPPYCLPSRQILYCSFTIWFNNANDFTFCLVK